MGNNGNDIDMFNIIIRLIILGIMVYYLRPHEIFKNPPHPDDAKFNDFKYEKLEYQKYLKNGGKEDYDTFLKKFREDYQRRYFENLFDPDPKSKNKHHHHNSTSSIDTTSENSYSDDESEE